MWLYGSLILQGDVIYEIQRKNIRLQNIIIMFYLLQHRGLMDLSLDDSSIFIGLMNYISILLFNYML